ncbi:MAG TPA: hypothetical protein VMT20_26280 [Terriglobia bacterium]|nr:hypothetical protein [Terriglobia bacterium]
MEPEVRWGSWAGRQRRHVEGNCWIDRPPRESSSALPVVLVGLISWAGLAFAQSSEPSHSPNAASEADSIKPSVSDLRPQVTLRVYNYAHLDSEFLLNARQVVAAIFRAADVEAMWIDCPLSPEEFERYPACQQKARTTDFVVRLITASMAARVPTNDGPLGFAQRCPDDERECVATVFYAKVDELAVRGDARAHRILGHAIAHEVGHLLLGPNAHSSSGLMRGLWTPDNLRFMNWSYLFFTPRQCNQLRASLGRRNKLELQSDLQSSNLSPGK